MKRKTKLLLIIIISTIIIYILYRTLYNPKKTLVTIGDSVAYGMTINNVKGYSFNDYLKEYYKDNLKNYNNDLEIPNLTSYELLNMIINNDEINENLKIKQIIGSADIITICIGFDELNQNGNINLYEYSMDNILKEIRKINKKEIYLIGLYIDNVKTEDINNNLKNLGKKYDIKYIDIKEVNNEDNKFSNTNILNYKGHKYIFEKIILS